ncbi:MAG: ATP-binding protein [Candidatus Binatia bacterium]
MDGEAFTRGGPRISIRAKLLLATALLLAASTLIYGYTAFTSARTALLPAIREQLADDAINVKGGLEEMLTAHYRNVHSWARLGLMKELASGDAEGSVSRFLESVRRDYGVYLAVVALDIDGKCLASSDAKDVGRAFAGTTIAAGSGNGRGTWEPTLEWSKEHDAAFLRLASPVPAPDREGTTLGTLVALLDRKVLDRIVVSKPGHSNVELRLFDDRDALVAGRETPLLLQNFRDWRIARGSKPDQYPFDMPPIVREGTDEQDRSYIVAEVPVGGSDTLPIRGWRLVASVPREMALAPVAAVRNRVLTTGVGLVFLGLLAAAWLADRLARPIKDLTEVAARIARSGNLEDVPAPRSHDEVGELARAFQSMVRAVAVANDEMVRTSKLAFLGEMAAGMAHEIRTPLGIIRSSAQLIERRMEKTDDKEAAEWAMFIREESDRLARSVTELLEFVKPATPKKSDVDLAGLARRSAALLAAEATTRGLSIQVADSGAPVVIPCDADQIHQVCLNLVMNALQASSAGSVVEVVVEIRGDSAALVVRDRGGGIPEGIAEHLFEPFTSQRDGGIGLGLAIVRRIVRAHGGEVSASNRPGGGAEFVVTLPRCGTAAGDSHAT